MSNPRSSSSSAASPSAARSPTAASRNVEVLPLWELAKAVKNFSWTPFDGEDLKHLPMFFYYLDRDLAGLPWTDEQKVLAAARGLSGAAEVWWAEHTDQLRRSGREMPANITESKKQVQEYFKPEAYDDAVRGFMMLKQTGSITAYIREFDSIRLLIDDIPPRMLKAVFMFGLSVAVYDKVAPWNPPTVEDAIRIAKTAQIAIETAKQQQKNERQSNEGSWEKGGGWQGNRITLNDNNRNDKKYRNTSSNSHTITNTSTTSAKNGELENKAVGGGKKKKSFIKCNACGKRGHKAAECRTVKNTHVTQEKQTCQRLVQLTTTQVPEADATGSLPTLPAVIGGHKAIVLFDSGATANFINPDFLTRAKITPAKDFIPVIVRTPDAEPRTISRGVRDIPVNIGPLSSSATATILHSDVDLILGDPWVIQNRIGREDSTYRFYIWEGGEKRYLMEGAEKGKSTKKERVRSEEGKLIPAQQCWRLTQQSGVTCGWVTNSKGNNTRREENIK